MPIADCQTQSAVYRSVLKQRALNRIPFGRNIHGPEINNNSIDVGQTRQRHLEPSHLWCKCTKCAIMGTDDECLCCAEFFLWHPDVAEGESEDAPTPCVTSSDDFPSIINRGVLETFFLSKRINWEERPEPEGENGHLSNE